MHENQYYKCELSGTEDFGFPPLPDDNDTEENNVSICDRNSPFELDNAIAEDEDILPRKRKDDFYDLFDYDAKKHKHKKHKKKHKKHKKGKGDNMKEKKSKKKSKKNTAKEQRLPAAVSRKEFETLKNDIDGLHGRMDKYHTDMSNIYKDAMIQLQWKMIEILSSERDAGFNKALKPLSKTILIEEGHGYNEDVD